MDWRERAASKELDGIEFKFVIWDIERIIQFIEKGEKEKVKVDFVENDGKPIPFIKHADNGGIYETYLAFIPAQTLADMYSRWGTRMLDMNVRVFLSARGKVNRGIRDTIMNEPDMFCAYNNGITVFARGLEFVATDNDVELQYYNDFQIISEDRLLLPCITLTKKIRRNVWNMYSNEKDCDERSRKAAKLVQG